MIDVLLQMAGLILCGVIWQRLRPAGLTPELTRKVLTTLVYYLLLPALVLSVMWRVELGTTTAAIAVTGAVMILLGMGLGRVMCRFCQQGKAQTGAMLLAMSFPNVTYFGIPVLEATFGPWARSIAIQYDMLSCTPLLFTLGIFTAARFGQTDAAAAPKQREWLKIPALWMTLVAILLNLNHVALPTAFGGLLDMLGRCVVPLMLFSLGLSLQWRQDSWQKLPAVGIVALIRLLVIPLIAVPFTVVLGLSGEFRAAVVMEAAMPSMVLGIMLCDRFGLDVNLYATAVTVTTFLSMFTLPFWHGVVM